MKRFAFLIALALLFGLASAAHAKKGGGGKPGGGGGDGGGVADADVSILYLDDQVAGAIWKGDDACNAEHAGTTQRWGSRGRTKRDFAGEGDLSVGKDEPDSGGLRRIEFGRKEKHRPARGSLPTGAREGRGGRTHAGVLRRDDRVRHRGLGAAGSPRDVGPDRDDVAAAPPQAPPQMAREPVPVEER